MKKVKNIKDEVLEHELELYKKYYEVDEETKIITFTLRYDSVDSLIEEDVSSPDKPQIKHEILERMAELIRNIPEPYHADIVLEIKDYKSYKSQELMDAIRDSVEFSRFKSEKDLKRNWVTASIFTLIGLLILLLSVFLSVYDWFNTNNGEVFKEVLDIAAWVFIWEAVSILFITPNDERRIERTLRLRMRSLSFRKANEDRTLCEEQGSYLLELSSLKGESVQKRGRYLLLISGLLMIVTGALNIFFLVSSITNILSGHGSQEIQDVIASISQEGVTWILILIGVLSVLVFAWRILGGIAGVFKYTGKGGKFQKFVGVYAISMLVYNMVAIIMLSFGGANVEMGSWFSSIFGFLMNLMYLTGYFMDKIG